jgi:hypothetical protein
MPGISQPAEDLSASQEGLYTMQLDSLVTSKQASKQAAMRLKYKQQLRHIQFVQKGRKGEVWTKSAGVYKML